MTITVDAPPAVVTLTTVDGETRTAEVRPGGSWRCPFCDNYTYPADSDVPNAHSGEWDAPCRVSWCIVGGAHNEEATRAYRDRKARELATQEAAEAYAAHRAAILSAAPLERATHGFGWACAKGAKPDFWADPDAEHGMCEASGHDRAEMVKHMRGHGRTMMSPSAAKIKLRRTTPAATLRKLKVDPLQWIEWAESHQESAQCSCGHWQWDHGPQRVADDSAALTPRRRRGRPPQQLEYRYTPEGCGADGCGCQVKHHELTTTHHAQRRGQFLCEGSSPAEVWVIPAEPAPWETGPRRAVQVCIYSVKQGAAIMTELEAEAGGDEVPSVRSGDGTAGDPDPAGDDRQPHGGSGPDGTGDAIGGSAGKQSAGGGPGRDSGLRDGGGPAGVAGPGEEAEMTGETAERTDNLERSRQLLAESHAAMDKLSPARQELAALRRPVPAAYGTVPAEVAVPERGTVARPAQRGPIDGAALLTNVCKWLKRYLYLDSEAKYWALTLWIVGTHFRDENGVMVHETYPIAGFLSSEPGSGKTHALECLSILCPDAPGILVEPSEPAVALLIDKHHRTILLDEGDILFGSGKRKAAIRAILNSGYKKGGTWARVRRDGVEEAHVFGAKAVAALAVVKTGTGSALDALMSRIIEWLMTKPPAGFVLHKLREVFRVTDPVTGQPVVHTGRSIGRALHDQMADWGAQERDALAGMIPEVPEGVGLREEEKWLPLLAVGACAEVNRQDREDEAARSEGDDWADLAWRACVDMSLYGGTPDTAPETGDVLAGIMADW